MTLDITGVGVSRDTFVSVDQFHAIPSRAESSQLRHSDQLSSAARCLQQPRRHKKTRSVHRQGPNQDRTR